MRPPLSPWPARIVDWVPALLASVPLALLLWSLRAADEETRTAVAAVAVLLALPWVVPAMMLIAALSVPLYMWLHTQGPVIGVLQWLGATLLVGAVIGTHVNASLAWCWLRRGRATPEPGLGDFLRRPARPAAGQRTERTR